MNEEVLSEPSGPLFIASVALGYVTPFVAFYFGIWIRHSLRHNIFRGDILSLREMMLAGVLFSLITVAPLLTAFLIAVNGREVRDYLMTTAVVVQAGMFMPESLGRLVASKQDSSVELRSEP